MQNAGLEGSVIVEKVKAEKVLTRGFDAESLEFVDMIQAGIIEPLKWSGWRCRTRRQCPRCCSQRRR